MKHKLTPRQERFVKYMEAFMEQHGHAPSLRQAAGDMGVSHGAVSQMIRTLEQKGVLRREGRYSRTLHLLNRTGDTAVATRWVEVPVIGRIAAGLPLYAQQEWDGSIVIDGAMYTGNNLFALRVQGDSMQDAAILDGDLVICEPSQYAENGDIIVALVDSEEATVKRFFQHRDHIELRPENADYPTMRYPFNAVLVQGQVVGVIRGPANIH